MTLLAHDAAPPRLRRSGGAAPSTGSPDAAGPLEHLRVRLGAGAPTGDLAGLPDRARRALAVATAVGAPALPALEAAGAALADVARARRAVHVATAQARAVAVGLVVAPLVLVPLLGRLLDAELAAFYTTSTGLVVAVAGLALLAVGAVIVAALVRRVGRPPRPRSALVPSLVAAVPAALLAGPLPALAVGTLVWWRAGRARPAAPPALDEAADLVAVALTGGVGPGEALRRAAAELPDLAPTLRRLGLGLDLGTSPGGHSAHAPTGPAPTGVDRIHDLLATAAHWGAPASGALRRLATDLRAEELARVLAAVERLPAQLTFPTALCLLPATLVLVGAPLIVEGLRAAGT